MNAFVLDRTQFSFTCSKKGDRVPSNFDTPRTSGPKVARSQNGMPVIEQAHRLLLNFSGAAAIGRRLPWAQIPRTKLRPHYRILPRVLHAGRHGRREALTL